MTLPRRTILSAGLSLAMGAAAGAQESSWRVWDTRATRNIAWTELAARLAERDAVFVGEQHGDPETHRAEAALLAAMAKPWGDKLTLAMEMLERDAQAALEDYLAGRKTEEEFAKSVTLWPGYKTDYRPLVEWAKAQRVPVLASNVPRRIARDVSKEGIAALGRLPAAQRTFAAAFTSAPEDTYAQRFRAIIREGHGKVDDTVARRFYEAQCLKDDTMAETVTRALEAGRKVLHINGSFHSDAGLGIPVRVLWRRPLLTRLAVVKIVPVSGATSRAEPGKYGTEADFILFVPDRRTGEPR